MADVATMSFAERLGATFQRTLPKLAPQARAQMAALIEPAALAAIAGVLVAWAVSHAFGVGEAIDIILGVVGAFSIGLAVFSGLDQLRLFASDAYLAKSEADLERAATHLAEAVAILGIQAVLAFLFKGRPQTYRGRPLPVGPPPPRTPGWRYRPSTTGSASIARGAGETSAWGDVVYSLKGTENDRALVQMHERIHQILTPKLYLLRNFRVQSRTNSYFRSSLSRYLEEALAETVAQIGVSGLSNALEGVRFPVFEGYVSLTRGGGFSSVMSGSGVVREGGALISIASAAGMTFRIWFQAGPAREPAR